MKYTKELFVAKATAIFDNLYDYTKFEFVNMQTKGIVTCNKCSNEWSVAPTVHISYQTHCPMCSKKNKQMSLEEFKVKAIELHNNKFDYSMVNELPNGASSKISIRCIEHNSIFKQSIRSHLEGRDTCKECLSIKSLKTNDECRNELKNISNYEKINFTKFEYKGDRKKVTITCTDCNTDKTILYTTLKNNGFYCKCFDNTLFDNFELFKNNNKDYLENYMLLDTYKYDGYLKPLQFKCNKHNLIFEQTPSSINKRHIGCDLCSYKSQGFSKTDFINRCNNKNAHLYLIKIYNENEEFYKIGITSKTIKERYKNLNKTYKYSIIIDLKLNPIIVYETEWKIKQLIKEKDYSYTPIEIFQGSRSECFKKEHINEIINMLIS